MISRSIYSFVMFVERKIFMKLKELIIQWVEAFNKGDADLIAEFSQADMTCIIENIFEDGDWAILEWKDPLGLRGCGFFQIQNGRIIFQRGYWDKLSFLRMHNLPIPNE
jgi:hypothetical protein